MDNCPSILKPQASGLNVCSSEICFDANFSCLNIPLGSNLNQALQVMEAALCWNGTLPSCITVDVGASMQDVIEAIALKTCLEEGFYEAKLSQDLGSDPSFISATYFVPANGTYSSQIHTNTSADTKTYIVTSTVAYGHSNTVIATYGDSNVDMAIFHRTTAPVDTMLSEVLGQIAVAVTLVPTPPDPMDTYPVTIYNNVYNIETSNTDMTEVVLLPGESVLLKFATKNVGSGWIVQSKFHVREKH